MLNLVNLLRKVKRACFGITRDILEPTPKIQDRITKTSIAKSISGNDIFLYKIGGGKNKVLFISAIHGNEVGTVKLLNKLISYLAKSSFFTGLTIYFIPYLNIDGYCLAKQKPDYFNGGNIGRTNTNGVDLNRNFPTKSFLSKASWNFGKNYAQQKDIFAGDKPSSEIETRALINVIQKESIKTIVSLHNSGRDITPGNDRFSQDLATVFARNSRFKLLSEQEWVSLGQTGTLKEWCEENGKSYLEIECSNRYSSDWSRLRPSFVAILKSLSKD